MLKRILMITCLLLLTAGQVFANYNLVVNYVYLGADPADDPTFEIWFSSLGGFYLYRTYSVPWSGEVLDQMAHSEELRFPSEFTPTLHGARTFSGMVVWDASWDNLCTYWYNTVFQLESGAHSCSDDLEITVYYAGGPFDLSDLRGIVDRDVGQVVELQWKADSGVVQSADVKIELSRDGGITFSTIAEKIPYNNGGRGEFDGSYDWTVTGPVSSDCRFKLTLSDKAGNWDIEASDLFAIEPPCCDLRGDTDNSGVVDIADLVYVVNWAFQGGPEPPCVEEANVDNAGDTPVDIVDLVYLINFMFRSGAAPVACP